MISRSHLRVFIDNHGDERWFVARFAAWYEDSCAGEVIPAGPNLVGFDPVWLDIALHEYGMEFCEELVDDGVLVLVDGLVQCA